MSEQEKPKRKDNTSKQAKANYANRRLAALNEAAKRAGFDNWRALEVVVYKDGKGVTIPPKEPVSELSENSPKLPIDI